MIFFMRKFTNVKVATKSLQNMCETLDEIQYSQLKLVIAKLKKTRPTEKPLMASLS